MRITCIGGGPAGLYLALLMKKRNPAYDISVLERNRPYDTFGWGVVFSDQTMGNLRTADAKTYEQITGSFNRWDDIDVHFKGRTITSGGHGFSGIGRRHLLNILQARCEALGVRLMFEKEVRNEEAFGRRSDRRLRRHQQLHPQQVRRRLRARHRGRQVPVRLARNAQAVRRLHLRLRGDQPRLVPGARLQVRPRHLDLHRRDPRGRLAENPASTG